MKRKNVKTLTQKRLHSLICSKKGAMDHVKVRRVLQTEINFFYIIITSIL